MSLPDAATRDVVTTDGRPPSDRTFRRLLGILLPLAVVVAYVIIALSYRNGIPQAGELPTPSGARPTVVLVPAAIDPSAQEMTVSVLLYPGSALADSSGALLRRVAVTVNPSVGTDSVIFPDGSVPSPKRLLIPIEGVVQQYPFDTYAWRASITVAVVGPDQAGCALPADASVLFRVPGWTLGTTDTSVPNSPSNPELSGAIDRAGSTMAIALLLLAMMLVLAAIAVIVVRATSRGLIDATFAVASWMAALLFALIPLRGFFPGAPPLGSWMDVLVFFWVLLALMVALALVVLTVLVRAGAFRQRNIRSGD